MLVLRGVVSVVECAGACRQDICRSNAAVEGLQPGLGWALMPYLAAECIMHEGPHHLLSGHADAMWLCAECGGEGAAMLLCHCQGCLNGSLSSVLERRQRDTLICVAL